MGFLNFGIALLLWTSSTTLAAPAKRATWKQLQTTQYGDVTFGLGNQTYLANTQHPKAVLEGDFSAAASQPGSSIPFTVIFTEDEVVTGDYLKGVIASYLEGDDVFSEDFLEGLYIVYNGTSSKVSLDPSALGYISSLAPKYVFLDTSYDGQYSTDVPVTYVTAPSGSNITAGPYAASISETSVAFNTVYRLYRDSYRDFLYGTYESNDGEGTFIPVEVFQSRFWDPMIPVPSRIYSWGDSRPFAGYRVAIKDLFDMKGLVTSGGSLAWAEIVEVANETAPSIQRIVDLGGVLVGKYKLAQFASGANPWQWQDEHYPFNPRGDGWLTCSASSSGGGCSVAAYDWLDYAIGTDTGSSMRRPAAVSGTYGNRPSQGLMTLDRVMPLGAATDTAGVFSRDVHSWVHFAKNWYIPEMCQDTSITGLSALEAPDSYGFPKRVLYTEYLPLSNPAAEVVLQGFIQNLTTVFGMTVENFNLTAVAANTTDEIPKYKDMINATSILGSMTQYQEVAKPLIEAWADRYDGRFPPIDAARRSGWKSYNESYYTEELYTDALAVRRSGVEWFESEVLYSTPESCSESIMLWDIGTGGLPSYREELMNNNPNDTAFLATTAAGAGVSGASLCPFYGCVDMTIPIGQVPYKSNITLVEEMVPVTVSVIAKRGCDFMLWNMWEKLADEGMLQTVKTGRIAF